MHSIINIILQTIKVFFLFAVLTIVFYFALNWFNLEYQGLHQYDAPEGDAIKVMAPVDQDTNTPFVDRLIEYYLDGE